MHEQGESCEKAVKKRNDKADMSHPKASFRKKALMFISRIVQT